MKNTSKRNVRRPEGWTSSEELREAYEECGENFGRLMLWQPERAKKAWSLLMDARIYPNWYLEGFRYLFIKNNPKEYRNWKKKRYRRRKRQAERDAFIQESKLAGIEAMKQNKDLRTGS